MATRRNTNPFASLRTPNEYAIEWEVLSNADEADEDARDDLGLTPADRAALGMTPRSAERPAPRTGEDARVVLQNVL